MQGVALLGEFGIFQGLPRLFRVGVNLSSPAWDGDATARNGASGAFLSSHYPRDEHDESGCKSETVNETHNISFPFT
jgi:hypothetical protein